MIENNNAMKKNNNNNYYYQTSSYGTGYLLAPYEHERVCKYDSVRELCCDPHGDIHYAARFQFAPGTLGVEDLPPAIQLVHGATSLFNYLQPPSMNMEVGQASK